VPWPWQHFFVLVALPPEGEQPAGCGQKKHFFHFQKRERATEIKTNAEKERGDTTTACCTPK